MTRQRHRAQDRTPLRRAAHKGIQSWLLVLPYVTLLVLFVLAPLVMVVAYAFTEFSGLGDARWVGLSNFEAIFSTSGFSRILANHVVLLLGVATWVITPLLLAVILHRMRGAALVRLILFIPVPLSPVIIGRLAKVFLDDSGLLNITLRDAGLSHFALPWLVDGDLLLIAIIVVVAWGITGAGVLLYTAALSSMSMEQVDAARVDGAGWWQLFRYIYEPHLRPVTQFWTFITVIATLIALFPWTFSLTSGASGLGVVPIGATTLDTFLYRRGLGLGAFGEAFAAAFIAWLYLIVVLGMLYLIFHLFSPDREGRS